MFADLLRDLGEDVPDFAAMSEREVVDELHAIDAALRRIEARAVALVDLVERSAVHTVDGHRSVAARLRANAAPLCGHRDPGAFQPLLGGRYGERRGNNWQR